MNSSHVSMSTEIDKHSWPLHWSEISPADSKSRQPTHSFDIKCELIFKRNNVFRWKWVKYGQKKKKKELTETYVSGLIYTACCCVALPRHLSMGNLKLATIFFFNYVNNIYLKGFCNFCICLFPLCAHVEIRFFTFSLFPDPSLIWGCLTDHQTDLSSSHCRSN